MYISLYDIYRLAFCIKYDLMADDCIEKCPILLLWIIFTKLI